jgi:hypothetical protein
MWVRASQVITDVAHLMEAGVHGQAQGAWARGKDTLNDGYIISIIMDVV